MGPLAPGTTPTTAVSTTSTGDSELPLGLQYAASEALGAADASYALTTSGDGFNLGNATNAYSAYIDAGGLRVSAGGDAWSLSVAGIGYGAATTPLGQATATATANRVEYDYGAVSQWFVNGPLGLQQGFTLAQRPTGDVGAGPLTIDLALGGSLIASADAGGASATLSRLDGSSSLVYGGLIAYDATGAAFPASMSVTTTDQGQVLSIQVDDAGAQYPLIVDPYVQQARVVGSVSGGRQFFGSAVSLTADGGVAVIGARSVANSSIHGSAYVFSRSGASWVQAARLLPSDSTQGDEFGFSTAISADGTTIVAGAKSADAGQGALYVFTKSGGAWTEVQKVTASDGGSGDGLGYSAGISANGSVIAAGAVGVAVGGNANQGAVYVFGKSGSTWSQGAKLTAGDGAAGALFGSSIAVSGDASTVMVGAPGTAIGGKSQQGAVYAYVQGAGVSKLTASDGAANDGFGASVTTNYDGSIAIVGSPYANIGADADQGAAYVYFRFAAAWAQSSKMTAADGAASDQFGAQVALSADGQTAAVSAAGANVYRGAVYMLARAGGSYTQTARLTSSDGATGDQFGLAVALSADGSTTLAGSPKSTVNTFFFQGASYFFHQQPTLTVASNPSSRTATIGAATTFTASSTGLPGRTVQWQVSTDGTTWTNIAGASRTWYTVTPTLADSGKRYRAVFKDSTNATANTAAATLTVVKASTTLTISSSLNPRRLGDPLSITIEAAAAVAGAGTPTGKVSLSIGAYNLSGNMVNGKAVFDVEPLTATGTYTATATYDGSTDPVFGAAQATLSQVVTRGTTSLVGVVPSQPVKVGQSVTLSAVMTYSGNLTNSTGGVVIMDGGQPIAYPQVKPSGNGTATATFTTTTLALGTHYLQFAFLGNPELFASSTGVYQLQVNSAGATSQAATAPAAPIVSQAGPATSDAPTGPGLFLINPGNKTATAGSPVTFTSAPTSAATSFSQWQVSADGTTWSNIVGANQTWYTLIPSLADSGKRYRVVFTNLRGISETSAPSTLTVVDATTTLKISSSVNPRRLGDPLIMTVEASAAVAGAGVPTGKVFLDIGAHSLIATLLNGKAEFAVPPLTVTGTYTATATYDGSTDPVFGAAQATLSQVVTRGTTSLVGVVPSQPVQAGQSVTLSAVMTYSGNLENSTGGVMIMDGGQPIAYPQVKPSGNGTATATFTTKLSPGTHYLQFAFLGNPELFASSTGVYQLQVNAAGSSGVASSFAAPSTFSSTSGASDATTATFVEVLEPVDAFASSTVRKNGRTTGFPSGASTLAFRRGMR
ncbi:hypothetical protein VT85_03835 [Planctomyces sp. SH-PL62]|nr:hypothetical protein VT85_03835 [Planctomyces sp. SH-PL62]